MVINAFKFTFNFQVYILKTIIVRTLNWHRFCFTFLFFFEVYCETCVYKLADEMLRCQVCQSPHPRGFPKVCLEFDHFLEDQFPEEYARRRDAIELKDIKVKLETPPSSMYIYFIMFDILKLIVLY
jgi:hypothetical protein